MIETGRLLLREFTDSDSAFFLELLNDPAWIRNIGDRHVRTVAEASGVFWQLSCPRTPLRYAWLSGSGWC